MTTQRDRLAAVLHETYCGCASDPEPCGDERADLKDADALLVRGVRVLPYLHPGDRLVIVTEDLFQHVRLRSDDGRRLDVTVPEPDEYGITTPVFYAVDDGKRLVDAETLAAALVVAGLPGLPGEAERILAALDGGAAS